MTWVEVDSNTTAGITGSLPWINVKDATYAGGATGDGVTDDAAAFAAALAAGGNIAIPPGTYIIGSALTLSNSGVTLQGSGQGVSILKAKSGVDFQNILTMTSVSSVNVYDLTFDVNQANRISVATTTINALGINSSTDCRVSHCTFKNGAGLNINTSGTVVGVSGCTRVVIDNCLALNCGATSKPSDGFFVSGDYCEVNNCIADTCTDTGVVIESSNYSGVVGCTMKNCGAAFAITNGTNTDVTGNYAYGNTVNDWGSTTATGGVQIGNPGDAKTGNVVNTVVNGLNVTRTNGGNAAIYIRQSSTATGRVKGLTMMNVRVPDSGAQAVLVEACDELEIVGGYFKTSTNTVAIQVKTGCTAVTVSGARIEMGGVAGVSFDGTTNGAAVLGCYIKGDGGVHSTNGVYFSNSATPAVAHGNVIVAVSGAGNEIGTDGSVTVMGANYGADSVLRNKTAALLQNTEAGVYAGTGSPASAVSAAVGSIYLRTNGGASTTLYVKESGGSGNTGWTPK